MISFVRDEFFPNIVPVHNARLLENGDVKAEGQTFSKYHVIATLPDASGEYVASELAAVERSYSLASTALKDGFRDHIARCFRDAGVNLEGEDIGTALKNRTNKKCAKNVQNVGSQKPPFVADQSKIKPHDEGFEAAECGSYRTSCPYDFDTPEGRMWMEGYRKAGGQD